MSSTLGVAKEIASLITGILLLFASCGNYMRYRAERRMQQEADIAGTGRKEPNAPGKPGKEAAEP